MLTFINNILLKYTTALLFTRVVLVCGQTISLELRDGIAETKSAGDYSDNPPDGYHDCQTDNAIINELLALFTFFLVISIAHIIENAPDED
jgi:hypothetical protein